MIWTIFLLSFIPALLWVLYFYFQDRYEKEPPKLLLLTFLWGCFSVVPALLVETVFQTQIDFHMPFSPVRVFLTMLMVGFTEEICKFFAVKKSAYHNVEFNEPMDGIVYCVTAAMGFAFVENVGYMIQYNESMGITGVYYIGIMRAIISMFGHASFGVIMGSFLGRAKFDRNNEGILIYRGIFFASIVHALYNYTLYINKGWLGLVLAVPSFMIMWRNLNRVQMDAAHESSPFKPEEDTYQPKRWRWSLGNLLSFIFIFGVLAYAIVSFNQFISFKSQKMNYSIDYPSYWKIQADKNEDSLELEGPTYRGNIPRIYLSVILREASTPGESSETLQAIRKLSSDLVDFKEISTEKILIDGRSGNLLKAKFSKPKKDSGNIEMLCYFVILSYEDRIVIFRCESRTGEFDNVKDLFRRIISTFRLEKGQTKDGEK